MTGSRTDAQDICQDVCCALVERIASFRGEAKFTIWLIGIVRNACHDHYRRHSTLARLKGHLAVLAGMALPPDGRDLFRRSWLASELARLSPLLRETVVLVVGEGMTHAEAATALGVSESTISGRMHEVRRLASLAKDISGLALQPAKSVRMFNHPNCTKSRPKLRLLNFRCCRAFASPPETDLRAFDVVAAINSRRQRKISRAKHEARPLLDAKERTDASKRCGKARPHRS